MSQMRIKNLPKEQVIVSDPKSKRTRVQTINHEPTRTQQQFKDECDINNIMKRYSSTGEFLHLTNKQGQYADFSGITDYREMLETVQYANEAFAALPAEVRKRFDNDPAQLLNFVQDKNNHAEGVALGLIHPPTPPTQNQPNTETPNPTTTNPK